MNLAYHNRTRLNFDSCAGVNNPIESTADGHGITFYRALH